jgi:hypothetical protein
VGIAASPTVAFAFAPTPALACAASPSFLGFSQEGLGWVFRVLGLGIRLDSVQRLVFRV